MSLSFLNFTTNTGNIRRFFVVIGIITGVYSYSQTNPFNFNTPDKIISLDDQLVEISGVYMMPQDSVIIAEQDEAGIVYFLDKSTGNIKRQLTIEGSGDFEDICFVHPYIYLIKSKGTLFRIRYDNIKDLKTFNIGLGKEDDIEGMGYDPVSKQLLFACKASKNPPNMYERQVFTYNLTSNTLSNKPFFVISRDAISDYLSSHNNITDYDKLWSNYNKNNSEFPLGPSGIAIDPKSKNIYVISSIGKVLMIFDSTGKLLNIIKLNKDLYNQPEGITFDSKGNLYISNEGKAKKGTKGTIVFLKRNSL